MSLFVTASAQATQSAEGRPPAENKKKPTRVIRLDAIRIEGRIQKPQAFYILQRANLNFDGLDPRESFIPKIWRSVEKDPFR